MTYNGSFYRDTGTFEKGKITFRDGEVFKGLWKQDGDLNKGYLLLQDRTKIHLANEDLVRKPWGQYSGKIINKKGGKVYEGGLGRDLRPDGFGMTIINGTHRMFVESNYAKNKMHGRQVFDYVYWGFRTEEYYQAGKPVGVWRYKTGKGYEYVYDVESKRQVVRFPYLNKDYYKGEVDIWGGQVKLTNGAYYVYPEPNSNQPKAIRVLNCEDVLKIKEIRKNFFAFEEALKVIRHKHRQEKKLACSSGNEVCVLDQNCFFKGNILDGLVTVPKERLAECLYSREGGSFFDKLKQQMRVSGLVDEHLGVSNAPQNFNYSNPPKTSPFWEKVERFSGHWVEGHLEGFCKVLMRDQTFFSGFFRNGSKHGEGLELQPDRMKIFKGEFAEDRREGPGLVLDCRKKELAKGVFKGGKLNGIGVVKNLDNRLQYFGNLKDGKRDGRGSLKFQNQYTFEGHFKDDKIQVETSGKLINDVEETVWDCRIHPTSNQNLAIVSTDSGHFILDTDKGIVLKANQ